MIRSQKSMLAALFLLFLLSACAGKTQLHYMPPLTDTVNSGEYTAAYKEIADIREDKEIDTILATSPAEDINRIMHQELMSTGLFKDIIFMSESSAGNASDNTEDVNILVEARLKELRWNVPDYDSIIGAAFAVSALTGGVGGLIYGSTETDVNGGAILEISVFDNKMNAELLNKEYVGIYSEKRAKLSCDTPVTKSKVVGEALKQAMTKFKHDLQQVLKPQQSAALQLPREIVTVVHDPALN